MAEVHIIGQISSACGFPSNSLFCKWELEAGYNGTSGWRVVTGATKGRTQVDLPEDDAGTGIAVFAHPMDVHYACDSVRGWPRLKVEVWHQDTYGRCELYGYGFVHVPSAPGQFDLEIRTWRPKLSFWESLKAWLVGGSPELVTDDVVTSPMDRFSLVTETMGLVQVSIGIILRGFAENGVSVGA
eukprot:c47133_g1_i1.p2 GENE.c47133_g1_i1~~c47133_g1_i1.p2  ORF type:complete len:185 (-),score=17.50 c47133_g1_i1:108-662(-)